MTARPAPRVSRLLLAAGGLVVAVLLALLGWARTGTVSPAGAAPRLRVADGYAQQPAYAAAYAYLTIVNSGSRADTLTGVESDVSADAMPVSTPMSMPTMPMSMPSQVVVPAHGSLVLDPGGYRIALDKPVRRLRPGEWISLTLRFRTSAPITLQIPVRPFGHRPGGH